MGTELTGTQKQEVGKEKTRRDRLAGFYYDLAKLTFAGTIIVNIPSLITSDTFSFTTVFLVMVGFLWTYILASTANRILIF